MRRPMPPMLSRLRIKARMAVTAIMEIAVIEMVRMEMVEMEIQMRMVEGTEGVVRLIRWFEKIETVFYISNCPEKSHVKNKIQKMETELWNLTVKNNDLAAYTQRLQELTMMCTKMVPKEEDQVEKFIRGLPDNIQGNVIAAEPTRLQDAVRIANNIMD
ncbi:putative reverse transcriptase domain-containing protein [Tanacetum coccineum]